MTAGPSMEANGTNARWLSTSRVTVLGVEIDALRMDEVVAAFERLIQRRQPALALSVNVDICMKIQRDPELRTIYRRADLVLVDGTPMMWAASFLGSPLPQRVSGSDFLLEFCRIAARRGYRIFLLGGLPGVAEAAKHWLASRYPGITVVGTYAPPFGFETDERENARIVSMINASTSDVLFVGFGTPKEQKWLFTFRTQLHVSVSMNVGSSFDYLAGRLKRAPQWMQRWGLEWTYRLVQEPRRLWRRYLVEDPPFVYHIIRERLQSKTSSRHWDGSPSE